MNETTVESRDTCAGDCAHCAASAGHDTLPGAPYRGGPFALYAAIVFILPLFTALAGAFMMGGSQDMRLLGGLGGGAVGILASLVIGRRVGFAREGEAKS
jgi:hypothetical protein